MINDARIVSEFSLIEAKTLTECEGWVNKWISNGWQPHGSPTVSVYHGDDGIQRIYLQSMVKFKNP